MITLAERLRAYVRTYPEAGTGEIAKLFGTTPEYVRVCTRQRADGRCSKIDLAYKRSLNGGFNAIQNATRKALRETGDAVAARLARHRARLAAKRQGLTRQEQHRAATRAGDRVIRATGDRALALIRMQQVRATYIGDDHEHGSKGKRPAGAAGRSRKRRAHRQPAGTLSADR